MNDQKGRHPTFISSRVAEILDTSTPSQWRHLPGKINVADDGSRGLPVSRLDSECRWLNGPAFLSLPEHEWPENIALNVHKQNDMSDSNLAQCYIVENNEETPLIDSERFSSYSKLCRTMCWVLRFVNNSRKRKMERTIGPISVDELKKDETRVLLL